ncbi:MAG: sensor histidine kinase [Thermus sp.]|uniref:sensor histidine kinase n=1 Tax=Thermus sp. TaxID=275 RepID=UPI003321AE5A
MSLRLRLTLFYTLLTALVLGFSGLALHFLLKWSLYSGLDATLQATLALARPLLQEEDGQPTLLQKGELPPGLPRDTGLYLFRPQGVERLGYTPEAQVTPKEGCFSAKEWRFCGVRLGEGFLLAGRSQEPLEDGLHRFDLAFAILYPLALLLGLGLGFLLAQKALAPIGRMTEAALEQAESEAYAVQLPEPRIKDELWRLARAQNLLLARLSGTVERERRFAKAAAHELRTPLSALIGRLEQAMEGSERGAMEKAYQAAMDLWALVERLLQFTRAERGFLEKERVDPGALVLEAVEGLRRPGVDLDLQVPEAPCEALIDPTLFRAMVRNLLDNALRFARTRVRVSLLCGPRLRLEVEDDGPGLEEPQERIFEPFYRGRASRGTGLGLALVKAVAEAHGGRIRVERGRTGARFVVEMPGGAEQG